MFNKKLKKKIDDLEKENEQLRTALREEREKNGKLIRENNHIPEIKEKLYWLSERNKELEELMEELNKKTIMTLEKIRNERRLREWKYGRLTLLKVDYHIAKENCIEHWVLPIVPDVELLHFGIEWIRTFQKSKKEGEVERIYFQPNVGWVLVRKYQYKKRITSVQSFDS